jgi:hypothetical protein
LPAEHLDGLAQQRGLARAGAGHQIQRKNAALGQALAVLRGIGVVLGQDVLLDLHHAPRTHPRRVGVGRRIAVFVGVRVFVAMIALVGMAVTVPRAVGMHVLMLVVGVFAVDLDLTGTAAACRAHSLLLSHFKFLDPHFGTPGHLHLVAAALRTFAEYLRHRHRLANRPCTSRCRARR